MDRIRYGDLWKTTALAGKSLEGPVRAMAKLFS